MSIAYQPAQKTIIMRAGRMACPIRLSTIEPSSAPKATPATM